MRLFLLRPSVVFQAQVNSTSFSYPLGQVPYDGVTVGDHTAVQPGMTVLFGTAPGGDDLGRQRVRKAATETTLYIGRSSRGVRDGEVDLQDDAYVTVLNDYRVWAKVPYITTSGTIYKDHDLAVGTHTTTPPPVANAGVAMAGTVDPETGVLRVTLPHEANTSFATAPGATIESYEWTLPAGVMLVEGYTLADLQIEIDCAPGFYWVALTVTDSNGQSHTARVPVLARDPQDDPCISAFQIETHRIAREGQRLSLRILEDIPKADYPDGTFVLLWEGEPADGADRSHMRFIGWHHTDEAEIRATRTGLLRDTVLECRDVAGMLDGLPGFSQSVEGKAAPKTWTEMASPNMDLYLHYLLHWHSTALEVADWTWSGTGAAFPFVVLGSEGESLYDQVNRRCRALVPDHYLTCNRRGQLRVVIDPMLQDLAQRTETVQATIDESGWSALRYLHQRPPRYHWHRGNAILAHPTQVKAIFCIAPGEAPGQGELAQEHGEQLARSQADLNACEGHRYARLNAPEGTLAITLAGSDDLGIEPADMTWVEFSVSEAAAAQRGLTFTQARGLPLELNISYEARAEGMVRTVELVWERETWGTPAVTVIPPPEYQPPEWELPALPPLPEWGFVGPEPPSGPIGAYVLWDITKMARTWDFLAPSPVWERIDGGITGRILDCHYVHVSSSVIGAWLLTTTAVWWCADIMATPVVWTSVLDIGTVQAADGPSASPIIFAAMHPDPVDPGYAIVATRPSDPFSEWQAGGYHHAYTWHTHDNGQSWTQVDMPFMHGSQYFWHSSIYSIRMFAGTPSVIWAVRSTGLPVSGATYVFISRDRGHTWEQGHNLSQATYGSYLLKAPFPTPSDPSWLALSRDLQYARLVRSTDGWQTGVVMSSPPGYEQVAQLRLPNSRTYEPDHVLVWWLRSDSSSWDLLESRDRGSSWHCVYETPYASNPYNPQLSSPGGWPADPNVWTLARTLAGGFSPANPAIRYTDDNFGTVVSKEGNLPDIWDGDWLGTGSDGTGAHRPGFPLPRVGPNS